MSQPSTLSGSGTHHPQGASRTMSVANTDRLGIFTRQDLTGVVLVAAMIWGPLAAGAFLRS